MNTTPTSVPGISATTSITDFAALGHAIAHANSGQQAALLAGLATGFRAMGEIPARHQMTFVRNSAVCRPGHEDTAWLLAELHAAFERGADQ